MKSAGTEVAENVSSRDDADAVTSRTFPADRAAPRAATEWLRSLPLGLSEARAWDAELCLDELVTNVVLHAWPDGPGHEVTVRVEQTASDLEITVENDGPRFDPSKVRVAPPTLSLDDTVPGGRGLMLVRSIAPRLRYEHRDGRNLVTVAFPLEG
jgi:anti-sigma regulatory factor (Ser/Thr protein kinase)